MSTNALPMGPHKYGIHISWAELFPWPALIIAAVALAVLGPFLVLGLPSGHDFEFHLNSWMEVVRQWKQGIIYPRWAAGAHYGFGEARFVFYPPGSWLLGGLLSLALPWPLVPAAYIWITLAAAGFSMFYLARQFFTRRDATLCALLYAVNPYHLVIVYWRSAFAELLASCLLPLLLLFLLRSEEDGKRMVVPLALVIAAGWLANAPAAVMINYSIALLAVVLAVVRRAPRVIVYAAVAVVLGAGLAAFYVVPAAAEEKWVNIAQVLAPGVRPQDNFLFTRTSDQDHNRFNLLVSLVATAEIAIVLLLGLVTRKWRKDNSFAWWTFTSWGAAAAILMLSPSFILWQYLPKLRFVQLPWRWLLCLNVAFAFGVIAGRGWVLRIANCAIMAAVLMGVWFKVQPPWWDSAADVAEMHDNLEEGRGYEGTDEYVPSGADAYEIRQDAPEVAIQGARQWHIQVERWQAESKEFVVDVSQPADLVLHLFNYPAWHVEVNGRAVNTSTQDVTGQMLIPVRAGESHVQVRFVRIWDRTAGAIVSLSTLLLTTLLAIHFKLKERRAA